MITIRLATAQDIATLQELNNELFLDNQKYDPDLDRGWAKSEKGKEYFTQLLNKKDACVFIAEENEKPIGYLAAAPQDISYRKSRYLEIENFGVNPGYRSQGIGSLLMKKCLTWAKSHGFQKVYVNAYFSNDRALAFYKNNGFGEIDVSLEREL